MRIGPIQRAWKHSVGRWIGLQPFAVLLITFRPDFEPPWVGQPHVTTLTINRLTRREVEAMIERVVASRPLSADIRQNIIERSDGIPLFVERRWKRRANAKRVRLLRLFRPQFRRCPQAHTLH